MNFTTTRSLTSQAVHVFSSGIIQYAIKIATPIILVRLLTREDYGLYTQVSLIAMTVFAFIDLGYTNGLYYLYARNDKRKSIVINLNFLLNITGIIFLPILLYLGADIIKLVVKEPDGLYELILPLSVYSVLYALTIFIEAVFVVQQRTHFLMYFSGIFASLRLILLIVTVYLTRDVIGAIYALIVYQLIRWLYSFFYIRKHFGSFSFTSLKNDFKTITSHSTLLGLGGAAESINTRITSLILIGFLNPAQFAIYAIAGFRLPTMQLIYGSVTSVVIPKIAELTKNINDKRKEIVGYWQNMTEKFVALNLPLIIFQIILSKPLIIFLFTDNYAESAFIFRILIVSYIVSFFPVTAMLRAFNKTKWIFKVNIAFLAISPAISYLLVWYQGLMGAAIAYVILMYMIWLLYAIPVFRYLKISLLNFLAFYKNGRILLISVILAVPLFFVNVFSFSNLGILIISSLYYFPIVYIFLWKFNLFNIFQLVREIVKK